MISSMKQYWQYGMFLNVYSQYFNINDEEVALPLTELSLEFCTIHSKYVAENAVSYHSKTDQALNSY